MNDQKYCYADSDVLINLLDIKDAAKLAVYERKLTMLRIMELMDNPLNGNFDLPHLQSIHKFIFQDIYTCAGQIRAVDIAKGNMFCNAMFIEEQAKEVFEELKAEQYLAGYDKKIFSERLAFYFAEINAIHPFREGNGRTQREFIRLLALKNGYKLFFANASADEMYAASKASFMCDYKPLEKLFEKCLGNLQN